MKKPVVPPKLAAFAWGGLAERGATPHETLDWLREQTGTDDVRACKRALYKAAADWLHEQKPWDWGKTEFEPLLEAGKFKKAANHIRSSRKTWEHEPRLTPWYNSCDAAIALGQAVEALPDDSFQPTREPVARKTRTAPKAQKRPAPKPKSKRNK